jgi:hypothetical protein
MSRNIIFVLMTDPVVAGYLVFNRYGMSQSTLKANTTRIFQYEMHIEDGTTKQQYAIYNTSVCILWSVLIHLLLNFTKSINR